MQSKIFVIWRRNDLTETSTSTVKKVLRQFALAQRLKDQIIKLREGQKLAYAFLGDGIGVARTHRGHRIFLSTRDFSQSPAIILDGEWERHIEDEVLRHVKPGGTVVEVGANFGYHTLAMAEKLGPKGRLYAVEANPEVFELLRWTIDNNGFTGRTKLFAHAATDRQCELTFRFVRNAIGGGHITDRKEDDGAVYIQVPGRPLDETLADISGVDLLRMDAEGAESLILKGAVGLMARSPNMTIITEWAPGFIRSRGDDPGQMVKLLTERGYSASIITGSGVEAVPMDSLLNIDHCELLFSKKPA